MPQRGDIPVNNFVRGLVTEASPLTFPPGASLDEVNFELLRDGSRRRRLGLDLEDNYGLLSSGLDSAVLEGARCQAYRWSIPNGNIDQDIGVVQIGNQIWFLDLYTANPSANILNGGNPIVATELNNDVIMTFTTLNNYLIGVANHLPQPYLFNYDPATDTVTVETAAIAIRDMWGVDDGLTVDGRPTALTPAHHYNLLNQGWLPDIQSTCGAGINAIDCTFNTFGIYPSNSDAWTYGRVEDLTSVDVKKFDPNIAGRNFVNNGNVARGHFIINLYDRGSSRSAQTGFTLPVDRETGRINAIAAFAGRIFYAGILSKVVGGDSRSPNLSGTVLFSQLFENKLNLVKCYQEADPTSPDINDIVDTDGGLIQIPECGYIWALKAIKESLFVFASNGVWEIRGGDNGFTATSFMVHKISNVGVYAPKSIVEVEGIIYFWAATGIHAIGRNENGVFQTTNLTIPTIQTLYNAIPDASKKNARGYYDLAQNRARWLYYSPETKEFGEAIDIDEVPAESYSTVGSPVTITSINSVRIDIAALTSSSAMVTYVDGSTNALRVRILTIDDLTVTTGTDQNPGVANVFSTTSVCRLTDTTALVTYLTSGNLIGCRVLTVSGGTVTAGSQTTFACIAGSVPKVETVSSTQCIVVYRNPAGNVAARSLSISGTTVTAGAEVVVSVNTTVNYQNVISISSSSAIVSYLDSTANFIKTRVVTISGSTLAVLGTEYNVSASGATTSQFTEVKMKNSTIGIVTWVDAGSIIKSTPIAVSGTVVTTGTIHSYSRNGSVFSHYYLPSGKSVMMYTNTSDNFPDMLVSTVSSSLVVEGSNSDLNNELSFELALDKLDNSRVIMIYRSFSGGLILALAARV